MDAKVAKDEVARLARLGDLQGARDLLENAIQEMPERADLRFVLGQVYARLGLIAEAESMLTAAQALDPSDKTAATELQKVRNMALHHDHRKTSTTANISTPAPQVGSAPPPRTLNDISLPATAEEMREFARRDLEKQIAVQQNRYRAEWFGLPWFSKVFAVALFAFVLGLPIYFGLVEPRLPATMPDVRGMSEMDARAALRQAKLQDVSTRRVVAPELPMGTAVGTEPKAGTRLSRSASVSLSLAGAKVKVPNVKGLDWGRAMKRLQEASINVETDLTEGKAKGTDPPAGTLVVPRGLEGPGTPVLLVMSPTGS